MNDKFLNESIFHNLSLHPNAHEKKKTTLDFKYLNNNFDNNLFKTNKFNISHTHQTIVKNTYKPIQNNFIVDADSSKKIKYQSKKKYSNRLEELGIEKNKILNFSTKFYKPKRKNTIEYKTNQLFKDPNTYSIRMKSKGVDLNKIKKFESDFYKPKMTYSEKIKKLAELNNLLTK